jgi:hypothetical protein
MALTDCLAVALEGKEITRAQHDRLAAEFTRLQAKFKLGSETTAAANAKQALLDQLVAETAHKKRTAKLAIAAARQNTADLKAFRNPRGEADVAAAALFKLEHNGEASFESVAGREGVIVGEAQAMLGSLVETFRRSKLLGDKMRRNRAQLPNLVRELFGEDTGDAAAKAYAQSWKQTSEWMRQRFNAAGGAIGKLDDWGLPQRHDPIALRDVGRERWISDIKPRLDMGRMRHPLTGAEITVGDLDEVLGGIWDGIVSDGWDARTPKMQVHGKGALANQRAEHRFLAFRDADAWLEYQRDYGGGADPFSAMMNHVSGMARDIASMEILGPNPNTMVEYFKQVIEQQAGLKAIGKEAAFAVSGNPADRAKQYVNRLDEVWGAIRGNLSTPVHGKMAAVFAGARNVITSAVMGSAAISSISDIGTQTIARRFAGIGGSVTRDYIRALLPSGRQDAVSSGLILDSAQHVFHTQARFIGAMDGTGWTSYLADRVLTLSGLTPFTQAGKHAFGLAFFHEAARQAGKSWADVHPAFRSVFGRYGIGAGEWEKIRSAGVHIGQSGLSLLRPAEVAKVDPKLASRWLHMVQRETEFAVPTGGHRARTILLSQNQRGTVPGEVLRSFAQFKSFGAVYAMLHGARIYRMAVGGERGRAAAYAGALALSSIVFGGLALQLKQIVAGKDPRPMASPEFVLASFLQGGGLGLYGDFFFSSANRYGGGLEASIGGPVASHVGDFAALTISATALLGAAASGSDTAKAQKQFGRQLINFARSNIPGGNVWYMRLAWERLLLDQAQYLVDPEANKSFKAKQRSLASDYGQGFWWKPGETAPARGPDLGNAGRNAEAGKAAAKAAM